MSYSIDIYRIEKDTETDFYSAVPIEFYPGSPSIPDSYIRSIRIDDLSIDPVNFFDIAGRKCRVELSIYVKKGWFTELNHSRESHPDFSEWFPFIFVVRKESNPIFIGGLKKQNYTLDELNGTETLYLSDALDIYIDISRNYDTTTQTSEWYIYMVPDIMRNILHKWTDMLNNVDVGTFYNSYYLNNINIIYPGFDTNDYREMWAEHSGYPDAERFVTCWLTSQNEIKIVFWIKYSDNNVWYAQGYQCWIVSANPFNIPRKAQYIGNVREGYHATSESALMNMLVMNGVLPSVDAQNITYIEDIYTIVSVEGNQIYVSGYFYSDPQRFTDSARLSQVLKCMLIVNMCTVFCTPKLDALGNPYTETRINSYVNPNIDINPGSVEISKYFNESNMTHINKKSIMIDSSIFDATSALIDGENKRIVLSAIYAKMLENIAYTITFSTPYLTPGVSSLRLGDIIQTSGTMGNWIITGISDEDENGLITFTCAGGY
jgi:hypothetical protein